MEHLDPLPLNQSWEENGMFWLLGRVSLDCVVVSSCCYI